ncbi:MAG: sugar transferase [Deltaproteobacteria bacterium]|nr:sugar transferase [Deltaproteobacteria bacterium]
MGVIETIKQRRSLLFAGDILLILAATELSTWIRLGQSIQVFSRHTGASTFTLALYITMLYIFDLYKTDRSRLTRDVCFRLAVAVASAGAVSAIIFYLFPNWVFGRGIFLIQMCLVFLFLSGWRWLCCMLISAPIGQTKVLIIGAGRSGQALFSLLNNPDSPYKPVGFVDDDPDKTGSMVGSTPVLGTIDELTKIASRQQVGTAILAITHDRSEALVDRIISARLQGLAISDMPTIYEELTGAIPVEHLRRDWLLFADGFTLLSKQYVRKIKRIIDVISSGILIIVSAPIMMLTAIAIRCESRGPVFFRQKRVGKDGKIFLVLKFRSMIEGAENNGAAWAVENDPRVTRVGRIIRLLRIDELPQILNVFHGEMSLVGPRPERPEFVKELEARIPFYSIRHSVRPGITGWAQVKYGYGASLEDALKKLEYDLFYLKNMSILLDIEILLKTIGVVLFGQGAR